MDGIQTNRAAFQIGSDSEFLLKKPMIELKQDTSLYSDSYLVLKSIAQYQAGKVSTGIASYGSEGALSVASSDNDWTDNNFLPGNHRYEHVSPEVCSTSSANCTLSNVVNVLNKVGVHPNQVKPFVPGQAYVGDVDLPGPFGKDEVQSTALYNAQSEQVGVRNETLANHALHPGVVERSVIQIGSSLHVYTEGGGFGSLGGPNIWFDDAVWGGVDQRVIDTFRKNN